ncbi:hypothetical protein DERF_004854 [Dermatophagoides farinae]|uniref:Uncharacterized protein n=1 Tax=Dermatophagoides farinae TaxID=6954 RepID=A0A922I5U6_DERFA|nr:hypothetical protein DERF_004854 [Dermatophagoides farinae]
MMVRCVFGDAAAAAAVGYIMKKEIKVCFKLLVMIISISCFGRLPSVLNLRFDLSKPFLHV